MVTMSSALTPMLSRKIEMTMLLIVQSWLIPRRHSVTVSIFFILYII